MKVVSVQLDPVRTLRRTGSISVHIVVQLHTDDGLVGLGEISDLDFYRMHLPDLETLKVALERLVLGSDPFRQVGFHLAALEQMPTYLRAANTYPPFQLGSQIAAGVEMALYDLAGKALNTPVYNLLGGQVRDRLEMTYPLFPARAANVDETLDIIHSLVQKGMTRFRYYVGSDIEVDERFLEQLRGIYGHDIELKGLDFQGRFYWKDALAIYQRLRSYEFDLIESVSWREDYLGMAEVRRQVDVAVSEHVSSYAQAFRLIESKAIDVFNVSHQSGGMWGAARLFAVGEAAGLKCLLSTTQELSIGTAAVAHLGATVPELHYAGDAVGPLLYTDDVADPGVEYVGTTLIVPDGPGLGVALDEDAVERLGGPLAEWDRPAHGRAYIPE